MVLERSPTTYFRSHGRLTASSAPALSASGCRPRRGFWPRDAFHAVLSVRVAFSDPWRSSDLADRLAVDRQAVVPGSRRFPPGPSKRPPRASSSAKLALVYREDEPGRRAAAKLQRLVRPPGFGPEMLLVSRSSIPSYRAATDIRRCVNHRAMERRRPTIVISLRRGSGICTHLARQCV